MKRNVVIQSGIDASGALLVDDKAMNIVGANEAGIRGVRFKDARAVRTLLIDAGVASPAVHEKKRHTQIRQTVVLAVAMRDRRIRSHALMDMKVRRFVSC